MHNQSAEGERRWELVLDIDYIFSGTESTVLVGFLEFSDDVMCVCLHGEDLSGVEVCGSNAPRTLPDEGLDLDDIPF